MKNILKFNPELAKNIWLELSLQRLITMPAILLLFVFLVSFISAIFGMEGEGATEGATEGVTEGITEGAAAVEGISSASCLFRYVKLYCDVLPFR